MASKSKFSKKNLSNVNQFAINTPTNQGVVGGVDKLIDDLKMSEMTKALGWLLGGNKNKGSFDQLKSINAKDTIQGKAKTIAQNSALVLEEIKKISTKFSDSIFDIALDNIYQTVKSISRTLAMPSAETPEQAVQQNIQMTLDQDTIETLAKSAESFGNVSQDTIDTLNKFLVVLQGYEKTDLTNISNTIIQPLESLKAIDYNELQKSIDTMFNMFAGDVSLSDIISEMSKIDVSLEAPKETISQLGNISFILKSVSNDFDEQSQENIKAMLTSLKDIISNEEYSLDNVITKYNELPTPMLQPLVLGINDINAVIDSLKSLADNISATDAQKVTTSISSLKAIIDDDTTASINTLMDSVSSIKGLDSKTNIEDTLSPLVSIVEILKTMLSEDFSKYTDNAKILQDSIQKLDEIMASLDSAKLEGFKGASEKIVNDISAYDRNIKKALDSQERGQKNTDKLIKNSNKTVDDVKKASEKAKEANDDGESEIAIAGLASVIMSMGAMMIIGSLIANKHPNFIKDAYRFGTALAVFVGLMAIPLVIIRGLVNNDNEAAVSGFGGMVFGMAATMIIGAMVYKWFGPNFSKYVKRFTKDFTLFMFGIAIPIRLMRIILADEKSPLYLAKLITRCTAVMLIGALFVMAGGGKLVKSALMFGVVLGAFILITLLPLKLYKVFKKDAGNSLAGISRLLVTATLVMMIGALFVQNQKLVKSALSFGWLLAKFLFITLMPIALMAPLLALEMFAIKNISRLIITTTFVLMIGGLFMMNTRLATGALQFAILTAAFVAIISLTIGLCAKGIGRDGALFVRFLGKTVTRLALILLIGGVFMSNRELSNGAWEFALLATIFVVAMTLVMRFAAKSINKETMKAVWQFSLGVLLLTGALAIGALVVSKFGFGETVKAALIIAGFTVVMVGILKWISKSDKDLKQATLTLMLMAVSVALLGMSFYIVHKSMQYMEWKELEMFGAGVLGMSLMIIGLDKFADSIWKGPAIAALMAVAIGLLGYSFKFVNESMSQFEWEYLGKFAAGVAAMAVIFGIIGIAPIPAAVALGGAVAAEMAVVLALLGESFKIINESMANFEWEYLGKLSASVAAMGGIFGALGLISPFIALGAAASSGMAAAMILLKAAFDVVNSFNYGDLDKKLVDINNALKKARETFDFKLKDIAKFGKGEAVALALNRSVTAITASFKNIHESLDGINIIDDTAKFKVALTTMLSIFDQDKDSPFNKDKMKGIKESAKLAKKAVRPMVKIASKIMTLVSSFAAMTIPDKWDKNGDPTHYRKLSTSEFPKAAANISASIQALVEGFANMTDASKFPMIANMLDDFKDDPDTAIERMFKSGSSPTAALLRLTTGISQIVGNVAETISQMASNMIPDRWNDQGKPTHFKRIGKKEYTDAAASIVAILSTMLDGIAIFGNEHADLLEEFANDGGILGIGKNKNSVIGQSIRMSKGIGEIISNVAEGIANYAKLSIPDNWNEQGKPIHFNKIKEEDFKNAAKNIGLVLTTFVDTIGDIKFKGKTKRAVERITEAITNSTKMMKDVAQCIVDYSSMRIPIFKENSLEIEGYKNLDPTMFPALSETIGLVIKALPEAIQNGYDPKIVDLDLITKITTSYAPMSDMLVKLVEAIKAYGTSGIVPIMDDKGNIIRYDHFDLEGTLSAMSGNVSDILSGMSLALTTAYKDFKASGVSDPEELGKIIEALEPISNVLTGLIKGVQAYVDLKIPKYDAKGNQVGFITLVNGQGDFEKLFEKMQSNITNILNGVVGAVKTAVNNNQELQDESKRQELSDALFAIQEMLDPVTGIINIVKNYAELKFPTGYGKDGKATGYVTVGKPEIDAMTLNLSNMISAIPQAVLTASLAAFPIIKMLTANTEEGAFNLETIKTGFSDINDFLANDVMPSVKAYAEYRIPSEFDKDGKPTKYYKLDESSLSKLSGIISNVILVIPNAMNTAIDKLGENAFGDEQIKKLEQFNVAVNAAAEILDNIYSGSAMLHFDSIVNMADDFNTTISKIWAVTSLTKIYANSITNNVAGVFRIIEENFIDGSFISSRRQTIIKETRSVMDDITTLLQIISGDDENSLSNKANKAISILDFKKKVKSFSDIAKDLAEATSGLMVINDNLASIQDGSAENAKKMLSSIKEELENITDDNIKKLEKESKGLNDYVKAINKVDIRRTDSMTRLFDTMNKFSKSVGNLDKFTNTLSNKIAKVLDDFTKELRNAEKTISNADKLRKEREKTMEKTLDKISDIMGKTLNVEVSSKSGDSISGSQTYSES